MTVRRRGPELALAGMTLLPAMLAPQSPASRTDPGALVPFVDSVAADVMRRGGVPGLTIGIATGGRTLLVRGFGYADVENRVPADSSTVYQIGSITKQLTAAAVLQLVDAGRLRLDDRLATWFPAYQTGADVTVAQLLAHTSGIPSYSNQWYTAEYGPGLRVDYPKDSILARFWNRPLEFAPGSRYAYNNSGCFLLGLIVEQLTGRSYGDHLAHTVFEPLGLGSTRYCDHRTRVPNRARGYFLYARGQVANADVISHTHAYSADAICSTVPDLIRWQRALVQGRVTSWERMATPVALTGGESTGYGFGLRIGELRGRRVVDHSGGYAGFWSHLAYYPEDSLTIVVLTNHEGSLPSAIAARIARRVLGVPEPPPARVDLTRAELDRLAGVYRFGTTRMGGEAVDPDFTLTVTRRDASLEVDFPGIGPGALVPGSSTLFTHSRERDALFAFQPSPSGRHRLLVYRAGATVFYGTRGP